MSQPPEPHVRKGRGRGRGTSRGSPSPSGPSQRESKPRPGPTSESVTQEGSSAYREKRSIGTRDRKKPEVQIYVPRGRRLHQQGDDTEADFNGSQQHPNDIQRLHKDPDDSVGKPCSRESLGSPSEQRRTKSGRKARPEMQRYVPRARRQHVSDSPVDRSTEPESWDDAVDSLVDRSTIPKNITDSPTGSTVKKFKSESAPSNEWENMASPVNRETEPIPSSSLKTLPDLVQDTLSGQECSASTPERTKVLMDTSVQVSADVTCSPDNQGVNSLSNSTTDSSVLSSQQCQCLDSTSASHTTIHPPKHAQCLVPTDPLPPSMVEASAGEKDSLSLQETVVMEEASTPDIVLAIPDTSQDSIAQNTVESLRDLSSSYVRQVPEMCGDSERNTENVSKQKEYSLTPTSGITSDKELDKTEEDEQSYTEPVKCDAEKMQMEEGDSQERNINDVSVDNDDSSHRMTAETKSKDSENNDFESHPLQDSSSPVTIKNTEEPVSLSFDPKERDDVESLELEKQLKAQAIAALDFSEPKTSSQEEEDEDSWDKMFDDNGDCLDPGLIEELTSQVGKVQIDKPKIDYLNFQPKEPDIDMEMYGHIIEVYDFPSEFLTRDLICAFKDYMSRGFDIKWVDDTHALGVFASPIAAQDALTLKHPLLKVRSLTEASRQSKTKAKKNHEFLQPFKARPETSASAARRLVSGALGLQAQIPREKREMERKQLKEAKEKRRKERRLKQDMWDGSVGRCAMDQEG